MDNEQLVLSDENLDEITKQASNEIESVDDIKKKIASKDREIKNDNSADDEVNLGSELGVHKKAKPEDIEEVFAKLPGTLFQLKSCLFRVSFINRGQDRFTAELING